MKFLDKRWWSNENFEIHILSVLRNEDKGGGVDGEIDTNKWEQ